MTRASSTPPPAVGNLQLPHDHRRVARRENTGREGPFDHGPGRHDRVVADLAARQYEHAIAEPDVLADGHRARLIGMARVKLMVIRIVNRGEIADEGVIADLYRLFGRDHDSLVNEHPVADYKLRISFRRQLTACDVAADNKPMAYSYIAATGKHGQPAVTADE